MDSDTARNFAHNDSALKNDPAQTFTEPKQHRDLSIPSGLSATALFVIDNLKEQRDDWKDEWREEREARRKLLAEKERVEKDLRDFNTNARMFAGLRRNVYPIPHSGSQDQYTDQPWLRHRWIHGDINCSSLGVTLISCLIGWDWRRQARIFAISKIG